MKATQALFTLAATILMSCFSSVAWTESYLSPPLTQALEAVRTGKVTEGQRALLFQNNDRINQVRLNGWITDGHYQAAQNDFARPGWVTA